MLYKSKLDGIVKMRQAVISGHNIRPESFFGRLNHRSKTTLQLSNGTIKQLIVDIPDHILNWAACMLWVGFVKITRVPLTGSV